MDFEEFPKMPRLTRECIITEKLDGTNAAVLIQKSFDIDADGEVIAQAVIDGSVHYMKAQSRTKFITPTDDNYGFAGWAQRNADELFKLGEGRHFGEWWGQGIQRKYNITEKRFSLFNVHRWGESRPACCHVVPALYRGMFDTSAVDSALESLKANGSVAAPGFMKPEGVVVFHIAGNFGFKKTIEKDEVPKGFKG